MTILLSKKEADSEAEEFNPGRFQTARATLFLDRFMNHFISFGGLSIIAAVMAIFVFIFWQILPLFKGAEVRELYSVQLENKPYAILGMDEWGELPFLAEKNGIITFVDARGGRGVFTQAIELPEDKEIAALAFNSRTQQLVLGTRDGQFAVTDILYRPVFEAEKRQIQVEVRRGPFYPIGREGHPVLGIGYGDGGVIKVAAVIQDVGGRFEIHGASLMQKRTLLGKGNIEIGKTYDLSGFVSGTPFQVLVNKTADGILVGTREGRVYYFFREKDAFELRQVFKPFREASDEKLQSMNFLFGDVSVVVTSAGGKNRMFSLFRPEGEDKRVFGQTKMFKDLSSGEVFYDYSLRNKAFLIGTGPEASIRYGTTGNIRWEKKLPFEVSLGVLGRRYDRLLFLDRDSKLHFLKLHDPHPEAGFQAFFQKVWYEGSPEPRYEWQSTGASDDFETKLSLIPLIIGTLKGTFYAMIFALPVALLAALYTSQFAHPVFRAYVKPTMEIMASLPSVVLGFLAALWLAPMIETNIPSVLMAVLFLPLASLLFGWGWTSLPPQSRRLVKPGAEWIALIPVLLVAGGLGWIFGTVVEKWIFFVVHPDTGARIVDFRLWWPQVTGTSFEQRNALVVGFMMGFAVIPIIFTITEDSLSNVPASLVSGSLALGASRWQTAIQVVLPTASAGIFSACMIGLGRAVGETMIVVMATGNTPIMDFNIFSGMRTLSANIAVELPEAPHHGTLYRTLFLGAMLLFMLTFTVNTAAEILRQHLREKYKTV